MWKRFLKDYFSYSASDRNGIMVLGTIILLIILLTWFIPKINISGSKNDLSVFREAALSFYTTDTVNLENIREERPELFYFDPNRITAEEMNRLGFSDRLIRTMQNYLNSGGKFFRKEDLRKIYGMTDKLYSSIEPFILIDQQEISAPDQVSIKISEELIELNSTDSLQLRKLPGIGNVLSSRIIRYRNLLGGFYQKDQLKEVFGISGELFDKIKDMVTVDTTSVNKLNLQNTSFNDLLRHPYIDFKMARRISDFVKNNPELRDKELLLRAGIMDSADYHRLKPYLKTNPE